MKPRILIFGAGKIGRSFIGPVFLDGGYDIVFADIAPVILDAFSHHEHYTLVEKDETAETVREIGPVRCIDGFDAAAVKAELAGADLCATCVGAESLPTVINTVAAAVADRNRPLDIILAENLKTAGELARRIFESAGIPATGKDRRIGIVETSIGKMVPLMPREIAADDPLLSWAEPFCTLIVDREGFRNPVPRISDLKPVSPITPWVSRKLYISNFGHAAAAYLGNLAMPDAIYMWEVLADPKIAASVKSAMDTAGRALMMEYPGTFGESDIGSHVPDLVSRFANRALGDTVYRVGRDLGRKLHRDDRVVGSLGLVMKHGLDPQGHLEVFRAALSFNAAGPTGVPDEKDRKVREAANRPEAFLRDIVQVDKSAEPDLAMALRGTFT